MDLFLPISEKKKPSQYVPVLYGEKQQQEYIVKEGGAADLGRMVPLWTLVYCDWDNQVHKKTAHLHKGRKMCLFIVTTVLDKWDKVKQDISYHSLALIILRYLIVPFWSNLVD